MGWFRFVDHALRTQYKGVPGSLALGGYRPLLSLPCNSHHLRLFIMLTSAMRLCRCALEPENDV